MCSAQTSLIKQYLIEKKAYSIECELKVKQAYPWTETQKIRNMESDKVK